MKILLKKIKGTYKYITFEILKIGHLHVVVHSEWVPLFLNRDLELGINKKVLACGGITLKQKIKGDSLRWVFV
ncbi:hypothetical protein UF75_5106 [Desulfosporosinus sp. I2]|nr:hypothetical protein UF75_5106 [Desulfosporosinus sp. I2]